MQCAVRESLPRGVIQVVSTSTRPPLIMCWPWVHKWSMHSGLFPGPLQSPGSPCSSHTHRIYCTNSFPVSWPRSSPRWGVVNCHASLSLGKICRRELGKKHQATHHSFAPTLSSPSSQRSPPLQSLSGELRVSRFCVFYVKSVGGKTEDRLANSYSPPAAGKLIYQSNVY